MLLIVEQYVDYEKNDKFMPCFQICCNSFCGLTYPLIPLAQIINYSNVCLLFRGPEEEDSENLFKALVQNKIFLLNLFILSVNW
jgi:hypothetical protein